MSLIIENFSKEWVPVLNHDQEKQGTGDLVPFSDAYLTGMPVRKRLGVTRMKPSNTLNGFIKESIKDVCDQQQSSPVDKKDCVQAEGLMREAVLEQIRSMTRARVSSDDDYNSEQHNTVVHFIKSTSADVSLTVL